MSANNAWRVLLLACVSVAWGRVVVDSPHNNVEAATCPHEAVPNTRFTLPYILLLSQYECYQPSSPFLSQLNQATSTDDYRRIFQNACIQAPRVKTCIADVARDADVCVSSLERKMFKTVRDFVDASIDEVCADGSETVAKMYGQEMRALDFSSQVRVLSCVTAVATKTEYKSSSDLPGYTMRRYKAIQEGKQCILNVARRKHKTAPEFERFVDRLLEGMECIDPTTSKVVSCQSLDTDENTGDILDALNLSK